MAPLFARIRWLSASIDCDRHSLEDTWAFWAAATASTPSEPWGDDGEHRSLLPEMGDSHAHVQGNSRPGEAGGVHLHVHVDDLDAAGAGIEEAGGEVTDTSDSRLAAVTPSGFTLCLVPGDASTSRRRAPPVSIPGAGDLLLDQVCIDVPHDRFDAEQQFWRAFTGFEVNWYDVHPYARSCAIPRVESFA
ncbi:MAG: VOC family protein [Acidimicrobiales bacterium]